MGGQLPRCYTASAKGDSFLSRIPLPGYQSLEKQISALALSIDAAELHGTLCGFLAGGATGRRQDWLPRVLPGCPDAVLEADSPLDALFVVTKAQFDESDMALDLLLPDEDCPVDERADGLLRWCRGFLGGFGLSGRGIEGLSEDGAEALADIERIATTTLTYADPDDDDFALSEIVEYVRIATVLLHEECLRASPARRLH